MFLIEVKLIKVNDLSFERYLKIFFKCSIVMMFFEMSKLYNENSWFSASMCIT